VALLTQALKDLQGQPGLQKLLTSEAATPISSPAATLEPWTGTADPVAALWALPATNAPVAYTASAGTTRSGCKDLTEAIKLIKAAKRHHKVPAKVAKTWLATMHGIASAAGCSALGSSHHGHKKHGHADK
jgi:hypothetical protein